MPEVDLNRPCPRQIDFAQKIQICETHFARACACFEHFVGPFCTTKNSGKVSRGRTGSSEMSSQNLYFFRKVDFEWTGRIKIDFEHAITGTRKRPFSSQSVKSGTENEAHPGGVRNRFSQQNGVNTTHTSTIHR